MLIIYFFAGMLAQAEVVLTNCAISYNNFMDSSGYGHGIYSARGGMYLFNTTLSNNGHYGNYLGSGGGVCASNYQAIETNDIRFLLAAEE